MVDNITIVEMGSYIKLVNLISTFLDTYLEMYLIIPIPLLALRIASLT